MKKVSKNDKQPKLVLLESGPGLSVRQWELLRQKDPKLLSKKEKQQLEDANKLLAEAIKKFGEAYDLSPMVEMVRALQTAPIIRAVQEATRISEQLSSLGRSIALPIESLISFQKNFIDINSSLNKQLTTVASAALASRSMFESFQSLNTGIVKSLSLDIASLGQSIQFTTYEEVGLTIQSVGERSGHIAVSGQASQTKNVNGYGIVHSAELNLLFTEIRATRSELSEMKRLIAAGIQEGMAKVSLADVEFRRQASRLTLKGHEIVVGRTSKQASICDVFFRSADNLAKKWDVLDLAEEASIWTREIDGYEKKLIPLLNNHVVALNGKINTATNGKFKEFFVLAGYEIFVNPHYL